METTPRFFERPALILGGSLIIATIVAALAFYNAKFLGNTISVTGSAEQIVQSDTAKWTSSFSRMVPPDQLKEGSSQMKNDLGIVQKYLKSAGLKDSEITLQPIQMILVCENNNNVIYDRFGNQNCGGGNRSYNLQQQIVVESSDVALVKKVSQESVDGLIKQGVIYSSQGVEYYFGKLADLRIQLLAEATANAKVRADRIAQSTGSRLGNLQSASMGVIQVTAKNSTDVSDYGAYDVSSEEKKVTAVVRAAFFLR